MESCQRISTYTAWGRGVSARGVAVIVRNKMLKSVVNVNCVVDCLISVKLKANHGGFNGVVGNCEEGTSDAIC